jgi:hypothetical protein
MANLKEKLIDTWNKLIQLSCEIYHISIENTKTGEIIRAYDFTIEPQIHKVFFKNLCDTIQGEGITIEDISRDGVHMPKDMDLFVAEINLVILMDNIEKALDKDAISVIVQKVNKKSLLKPDHACFNKNELGLLMFDLINKKINELKKDDKSKNVVAYKIDNYDIVNKTSRHLIFFRIGQRTILDCSQYIEGKGKNAFFVLSGDMTSIPALPQYVAHKKMLYNFFELFKSRPTNVEVYKGSISEMPKNDVDAAVAEVVRMFDYDDTATENITNDFNVLYSGIEAINVSQTLFLKDNLTFKKNVLESEIREITNGPEGIENTPVDGKMDKEYLAKMNIAITQRREDIQTKVKTKKDQIEKINKEIASIGQAAGGYSRRGVKPIYKKTDNKVQIGNSSRIEYKLGRKSYVRFRGEFCALATLLKKQNKIK